MAKKIAETPLMKQYLQMKEKHPDAILLFRVGDFYETFSDDAIAASELLGITLTKRANGSASSVELAGFPHHALDTYLPKLIRAGRRVAICEQLEDPKTTKKLVRRGITELVTPGVSISDNLLNHKENNFLAAIHTDKTTVGVAFLDISTGEFLTAEGTAEYAAKLLQNFAPKELLVERGCRRDIQQQYTDRYLITELDDWVFTPTAAHERLLKQFATSSLKGFGVHHLSAALVASGAILHYLDITNHTRLGHITAITAIEADNSVRLDRFTVRNLELFEPIGEGGHSLIDVIDRTVSPMGARLLRRWVAFPLKDHREINKRLDIVEHFFRHPDVRTEMQQYLGQAGDLERLCSKIATARVTPRELLQLRTALLIVEPLKQLCLHSGEPALESIGEQLNPCASIAERIGREIMPDAPVALGRGDVIRPGVDPQLDQLRTIARSGKDYLLDIQQREIQATGIPSLKVAFNNVFGYYIEVTNTHRAKVPPEWIRKQTLVNAERYITQELKEYEEKILGAQDKIAAIEQQLYTTLLTRLIDFIPAILLDASLLARIDASLSLTVAAHECHYNRPVVDDSLTLSITNGRHPVIERQLPPGQPYIANSLTLDPDSEQIMVITGPNMSGKSALLRQTALITLMAQIGSFVPAESARIGVVDKIFTRVGASDNISLGESTFMVEMNEAAAILNNLSPRSLILFDELGRGTSTYDGISIAWAIVEHIHSGPSGIHPKTLFATHYHELNELSHTCPRVANYNVAVKEIDGKVVFLRRLQRGGSEHSFGIHVARLAGMPPSIVERARQVLAQLETANREADQAITHRIAPPAPQAPEGYQLSIFQLDDPVLSQLRDEILTIDINNLTPMAALNKLHHIKSILTGR